MCLVFQCHIKVFWVFAGFKSHTHTHMKPHPELLLCRSGEKKPKRTDQSRDIINSEFWGKSISFQSSFTFSHLDTIFLSSTTTPSSIPPLCVAGTAAVDASTNRPSSGLESTKLAAGVARDTQPKLQDGAHVKAVLRCRVQQNQTVYC